uniref:Uncharacterized protein n=1 Tax=Anopheles coluzzii TaxID=1518534 RepID=A0A8W7Q3I8_ANOCL
MYTTFDIWATLARCLARGPSRKECYPPTMQTMASNKQTLNERRSKTSKIRREAIVTIIFGAFMLVRRVALFGYPMRLNMHLSGEQEEIHCAIPFKPSPNEMSAGTAGPFKPLPASSCN